MTLRQSFEIMLKDLLKCNNLGNKEDIGYILFNVISEKQALRVTDFKRICSNYKQSLSLSHTGILLLLEFLSFVEVNNNFIYLNKNEFDKSRYDSYYHYFESSHFYDCLFRNLAEYDVLKLLFNLENLKFDYEKEKYFLLPQYIKLQIFPIRNLLLALNFLESGNAYYEHVYVNTKFKDYFVSTILKGLELKANSLKYSLENLKKIQTSKQEAGKIAEQFVFNFEIQRLSNHIHQNQIEIISDYNYNAGFDIISFEDNNSLFHNRFIEVKSYNQVAEFYWSKNEIETAKYYGRKYYLYLVDRSKINDSNYIPKIIQNPYNRVFENEVWIKEAQSWKISIV